MKILKVASTAGVGKHSRDRTNDRDCRRERTCHPFDVPQAPGCRTRCAALSTPPLSPPHRGDSLSATTAIAHAKRFRAAAALALITISSSQW
jgi:hypothetical protein